MPLKALINQQEKVSISFSDQEWADLKESLKTGGVVITLPCCDQTATIRRSSKGLKHFVHLKGENICDWKPESAEHLAAKAEIIKACLENGWQGIPEYAENGWRADVLAVKGDKRIAFEVQWSTQTNNETESRQEKYRASNVRGCWFFKTVPKQFREYKDEYIVLKELPFFKIFKDTDQGITVMFNEQKWPLYSFISALLNRRIKFCESYSLLKDQEIEFTFFKTSCWKCSAPQHLYTVGNTFQSNCKNAMSLVRSLWQEEDPDKYPEIVEAAKQITASEKDANFKLGEVKMRYSNTVRDSYVSFGCYYCDAIFGDFHLAQEKREILWDEKNIKFKRKVTINNSPIAGNHWCYSEEKKFCI